MGEEVLINVKSLYVHEKDAGWLVSWAFYQKNDRLLGLKPLVSVHTTTMKRYERGNKPWSNGLPE